MRPGRPPCRPAARARFAPASPVRPAVCSRTAHIGASPIWSAGASSPAAGAPTWPPSPREPAPDWWRSRMPVAGGGASGPVAAFLCRSAPGGPPSPSERTPGGQPFLVGADAGAAWPEGARSLPGIRVRRRWDLGDAARARHRPSGWSPRRHNQGADLPGCAFLRCPLHKLARCLPAQGLQGSNRSYHSVHVLKVNHAELLGHYVGDGFNTLASEGHRGKPRKLVVLLDGPCSVPRRARRIVP
jgi:hypothetical protein